MARPAWVNPRMQSKSPVSAVVSDIAISVGASRSALPRDSALDDGRDQRPPMTTEMELSGPATAKGSELRQATIVPPTAADKKVTAMP